MYRAIPIVVMFVALSACVVSRVDSLHMAQSQGCKDAVCHYTN